MTTSLPSPLGELLDNVPEWALMVGPRERLYFEPIFQAYLQDRQTCEVHLIAYGSCLESAIDNLNLLVTLQ